MSNSLPISLSQEPLVDAVFEVRFDGDELVSDLLPGALSAALKPKPKHSRLPAAEIPQPLRSSDPNLRFTPVARLELDQYAISVGDHNVVIGCKLPYPKWPSFRTEIFEVMAKISDLDLDINIGRYSLKYVNLIESKNIADQLSKIDLHLKIGGQEYFDEHVSVQANHRNGDFIEIIKITTNGKISNHDNKTKTGVIVDIDTIKNVNNLSFADFNKHLHENIEHLKLANKERFFGCLKAETIEQMGPQYD